MNIEGGSSGGGGGIGAGGAGGGIGGGLGGIGGGEGIGGGVGVTVTPSFTGGFTEAGVSLPGAAPFSGSSFGEMPAPLESGQAFGAAPDVAGVGFKEGPVGSLEGFAVLSGPLGAPDLGGEMRPSSELASSVSISAFGAELAAPSLPLFEDRAVNLGDRPFLEGFQSMNAADVKSINPGGLFLGDIKEIKFNTDPELVQTEADFKEPQTFAPQPLNEEAVEEVELQNVALQLEPGAVLTETNIQTKPYAIPNGQEFAQPKIAPTPALAEALKAEPVVGVSAESKTGTVQEPANKVSQTVATKPVLEEEEEIVTEKVVKKVQKEVAKDDQDKEKKGRRKKFVVDKFVLEKVVSEIGHAAERAMDEAEESGLGRKILGKILVKFLPKEHAGNMGGAVKPHGPDGTVEARKKLIASIVEFNSKKDVQQVAYTLRPVDIKEEGEESKPVEVVTTFNDQVVKPSEIIEEDVPEEIKIVRKRLVMKERKQVPVTGPSFGEPDKLGEGRSLEELDHQLAGVLKAA